jgi:arabinose-5-phosphate isomerase
MTSATDIAREVVTAEAAALHALAEHIGRDLPPVLETLRAAQQIVVSGLGKSGNVAQKIAATLTSTGSPAVFMHPVEALHGDLGIVTERHCLVALSRSGNTDELLRFVEHFRRLGGPVVAITQVRQSRLAELARHTVLLPDLPEAGPLALAPTTSTILQLAAGDAIAMALLHARGFAAADFAQYHPEGALGRRLLLRARDLMHAGDQLPLVRIHETFDQLLLTMTRKQLGLALVVHPDGKLLGTFTDGDLRRILERVDDPRRLDAASAHGRSRRDPAQPAVPVSTVEPEHLAVDCLQIMRDSQITSLVVSDAAGRPVGLLRLLDLLRAGLA